MRTGDCNARLASIFKTSKAQVQALLSDIVPSVVGFDHMTREEVAQGNLMAPERLFGNSDSPIEQKKAISIVDGT